VAEVAEAMARNRPLFRKRNTLAICVLILFCLAVFLALALDFERRLEALARANSDRVQWSLAQMEVDTQHLRESLGDPVAELDRVRQRFDIFYSRIDIFQSGRLYADLRQMPGFTDSLTQAADFAARALPLMDGPDDALRAALPLLHAETGPLRQTVRGMALVGIEHFSAEADIQRTEVQRTLKGLGMVTALMILALSILAIVLLRLYQAGRVQAQDNRLTTARLETIVNSSVDAIVVVDRMGRVQEFNPAAEQIFGYTRSEACRAQVTDLIFPPDAVADTIRAIKTHLIGPAAGLSGIRRIELEAVRKDRSRFPVELSVATAENAEGEVYVAFLRDISDRRQAERDLTEARDQALKGETAKADFLAVMSHEMRTPLNGLLGSVEILGATPLQAPQREILEVIETSGQVLLQHVNAVLDLTRAEARGLGPARTPFVLEALVREVVANQSGLAASGGNTIETLVVSGPIGRVLGDPARLRQILLNLVGNAVKFTRNGTIRIEIDAADPIDSTRSVEIRVIDTGIGVAEADQARIFDDFVTLDSSYGRETGGTGLGLGITRRLVAALGGEIGVESEPGLGSLFWVRLPFALEDALPMPGEGAEQTAPSQPPAPLSVLVIEDNAINRFVLRMLLEEAKHTVTEAVDGEEGVALANAAAHDVILMDISMPRIDGVEAARRIRSGTGPSQAARIIAVTAHALPEELDRFRQAGIDDCLVKPVTRGALARVLSGRAASPAPIWCDRMSLPLIDTDHLDALLCRLERATAQNLLRRFILEGDMAISRLAQPSTDPGTITLCHQLAGSAATFGAKRLAVTLTQLEQARRAGMTTNLRSLALTQLWAETKAALCAGQPVLLPSVA
jgi:PAS domain S-box-containing protein